MLTTTWKTILRNFGIAIVIGCSLYVVAGVAGTDAADTYVVPDRSAESILADDCIAPAKDEIPATAIVSLPGEEAAELNSSIGFAIWLGDDKQAGTGDERPGTVHRFCR